MSLATRIMLRGLREKTDEKEEELAGLIVQVEKLAAVKGSGSLGDIMGEWDAGNLYSTDVKRENVVDVAGNVAAAQGTFNHPLSNGSRSNSRVAAAVSKTNSRAALEEAERSGALSGSLSGSLAPKNTRPVEVITEEVFRPPEWAKNEKVKVVVKENARAHTQDVDLGQVVGSLATNKRVEARENATAPTGNVKSILEKWGKNADEEARKLKEQKEKEMEAERKRKEEAEAAAKAEAEEKARKEADEQAKKEAEEKAKREAEEAEALAKAEAEAAAAAKRKVQLPGISPIEPTDDNELLEYLEKKNMILDKCIFSATERIKVLKAM